MHSEAFDNTDKQIAAPDARGRHRYKFSTGVVLSVALHALVLSALIVILGRVGPDHVLLVVPVDVVQLADQPAGPLERNKAEVPQQKAAPPSSPVAKSVALSAKKSPPAPDDLEIKLRKLAQLRQPIVDTHIPEKGEGLSRRSTMRPDAAVGSDAALKDFLRDQIEHHWSPDLAILHGRNISVLIRIAMTSAGVITKAEVVNGPQVGLDPVYDDVALSARDAALLSSPLTLPPGRFAKSMNVILSLNTRDALR